MTDEEPQAPQATELWLRKKLCPVRDDAVKVSAQK
jgi:hypothetical protein